MNLNEVQSVHFLLQGLQLNADPKQDFSLVVSYKGKILTADFLIFTSQFRVEYSYFDADFDLFDNYAIDCLPVEVFNQWERQYKRSFFATKKIFSSPDILLKKVVEFVTTVSKESSYQTAVTNLIKNIHFLESGLKFDSMLFEEEGFEILSIIFDKEFNFIST